jgi:hypothetical protein
MGRIRRPSHLRNRLQARIGHSDPQCREGDPQDDQAQAPPSARAQANRISARRASAAVSAIRMYTPAVIAGVVRTALILRVDLA